MKELTRCHTAKEARAMSWYDTAFTRRLGLQLPIVQAPMAGGCSTPRLAAAVSAAGGLGSVAGAMLQPEELRAAIREVRALTEAPFAVNLFAPLPPPSPQRVAEWARLTGVSLPEPPPAVRFEDQLAVILDEGVPVLSFTFGVAPLTGVNAATIVPRLPSPRRSSSNAPAWTLWWRRDMRRAGTARPSSARLTGRWWERWHWCLRLWTPCRCP
jgi:NAD(P)H-dependent flavin oxidoreductase YrpB (nitropropane dioxygenase family)